MTNSNEKIAVLKECLMPSSRTVWCIDDRKALDLKEKGPQLLGGSLAPLPALVEAAIEADTEPEIDQLIDIVFQAHKDLRMTASVHKDDHHGEWGGCGFAALLADSKNPLGLAEKSAEFFQKNTGLVEKFVQKGARLIVLEGDHGKPGKVMAVRNSQRKKTLDIIGAHKNKLPAYNHDDWFYEDLMGRCVEVLQGNRQAGWAEKLQQGAEQWNNGWLDKTTNILAGMKAVSLQGLSSQA